jgi:hypothetical protein
MIYIYIIISNSGINYIYIILCVYIYIFSNSGLVVNMIYDLTNQYDFGWFWDILCMSRNEGRISRPILATFFGKMMINQWMESLSLSRTSRWNVVSYFLPNPLAQLTLFGCRVWVFLPWSKTVVLEYVCKLYPLSLLRNMSILILFVSELGSKSLFWRVTIHQPEIKPRWDSYPYPPCCPTFLWCHSEVVTNDPHF